jgi:hypothetical protein
VTLELVGPSGTVGRYTRRLGPKPLDPTEDEEMLVRLEAGSCPSFVYPGEPFEVNVKAVNDSAVPVTLEVVERRLERTGSSRRRLRVRALGDFELPPVGGPGSDVVARRMNRITRRFESGGGGGTDGGAEAGPSGEIERLTFLLGPPGAPATLLDFPFLSSRALALPEMRADRGGLAVTSPGSAPPERELRAGGRAIFVMPYDSEGDLRKWAVVGGISLEGADAGKVLFFGDALESPGAVGGEGLAHRMKAALAKKDVALAHVGFGDGAHPVHAAAARVSRELMRSPWSAVWISLGALDVRAGTPLRQYERGIDFMMDRARVLAPQARLVIVGPPPELGREDVSARYAKAAREVVERHRVPFVDLHELVTSLGPLDEAYREEAPDGSPDDGVRFPYPLGRAMDSLARETLAK